jgi:seryl-tRNA synthetase
MLDIRLIREKPDFVRERLATRGGGDEAKIDDVSRVDVERRQTETALQQLNADRKRLSKEIGGKSRAENRRTSWSSACAGSAKRLAT